MKLAIAFVSCAAVGVVLALVQECMSKLVYRITLTVSAVVFLAAGWYFF